MKNTEKKLDDIIFENRNKDYGAYSLRKSYNKNMMSAMVIAIVIFLLGVSIPLIANYYDRERTLGLDGDVTVVIDAPPTPKIIDPLPLTAVEKKKVPVFRAPIIIDSDEDIPDDDLSLLIENTGNTNPADTGAIGDIPEVKPNNNTIDEVDNTPPPTYVEEMPKFPGGDEGRIKFLSENIKYPQIARELGIQGPVYATFVVEKDGRITNVKLLRGIGGGCDEEALRVIGSMPKWEPGRQNGKEVRVQFNMPINFKLM